MGHLVRFHIWLDLEFFGWIRWRLGWARVDWDVILFGFHFFGLEIWLGGRVGCVGHLVAFLICLIGDLVGMEIWLGWTGWEIWLGWSLYFVRYISGLDNLFGWNFG